MRNGSGECFKTGKCRCQCRRGFPYHISDLEVRPAAPAAVIRASSLTRDQVIYAPAMTLTLSGLARETEPWDAPAYRVVSLAPAAAGSRTL